jgi:hypothetical protein
MRASSIARIFGWALSLSLPTLASAQAAPPCLTPEEAQGLMTYALPSVVLGLRKQCLASLPATAPLIQAGPLMAARYQPDADAAWPVAQVAIDKLVGMKLAGLAGPQATKGLIERVVGEGLTHQIKSADCSLIDRMVDTVQPLPTRNMAVLVTSIMELMSHKQDKPGPFNICAVSTSN